MEILKNLNKKFFPLIGAIPYLLLTPVLYILVSLYAMVFPPLDVAVYKRAADFAFAGLSPYSEQFITGDVYLPWVYTPFATLILSPLHFIPEQYLLVFWTLFGIFIPLVAIVILSYQGLISRREFSVREKKFLLPLLVFLALSTGPVIDAWAIGQIGVVLVALTLFDLSAPDKWFKFRKFSIPRGIFVGIAGAIKLVPLIAIPYWILIKQGRAAFTAFSTLLVAWTVAFAIFPADSIKYFSERLFLGTRELENAGTLDNQSLIGTALRVTNENQLSTLATFLLLIVIATLGLYVAKLTFQNNDNLSAGLIVGLTSVLASPVSWIHHIVWLAALPGALLASNAMRKADGKVSKVGWLWFGSLFVMAIPPVRYGWSPVTWVGLEEHYSLVCIVVIWLLWWRSNQSKPQAKN